MADALMNLSSAAIAFGGEVQTAAPTTTYVNWRKNIEGLAVRNAKTDPLVLDPGATVTAFSSVRATGLDNTSAFNLGLSPVADSVYRLTLAGGTDPDFRTDRGIDLTGLTVVITVNNNSTVKFQVTSGTPFSGVTNGDWLFIPGVISEGSVGEFSPENEGYWVALSHTSASLVCKRPTGTAFSGIGETVTSLGPSDFVVYSAAGVQIGDTMRLSSGFSSVSLRNYTVSGINSLYLEFTSSEPLPVESVVTPGASGITFYASAKRFVRVESDRLVSVRFNGGTGDTVQIDPWAPGSHDLAGWIEKVGSTYALEIENKTETQANVTVITAE